LDFRQTQDLGKAPRNYASPRIWARPRIHASPRIWASRKHGRPGNRPTGNFVARVAQQAQGCDGSPEKSTAGNPGSALPGADPYRDDYIE